MGVIAMPLGLAPVVKGDPGTWVKAPFEALMLKTATFPPAIFIENRSVPPLFINKSEGSAGVDVRGRTSVSAPELLSILSKEIVLSAWFATYKNWFDGCNCKEIGEFPTWNGDPSTLVKFPELSIRHSLMPLWGTVTKAVFALVELIVRLLQSAKLRMVSRAMPRAGNESQTA